MKNILAAVFLLPFLFGCNDDVSEHYSSYLDAANAGLFERGWLPGSIPTSANKIQVHHNLDTNQGYGEFSFNPLDAEEFLSTLSLAHNVALTPELEQGYKLYVKDIWHFWVNEENGHVRFEN